MRSSSAWLVCALVWTTASACSDGGSDGSGEAPPAATAPVGESAAATKGGPEQPTAPKAEASAAPADDPTQPMSRRILGRWHLNLASVPDLALTNELLEVKRKGLADKIQVDYEITETEVIVERGNLGARAQERWSYEIVSESGDRITVNRTDQRTGKSMDAEMRIEDGMLWVGTEGGKVPLERVP